MVLVLFRREGLIPIMEMERFLYFYHVHFVFVEDTSSQTVYSGHTTP